MFKMPQLEPIIIPTRGLSFMPTLWALLTSVRRWRVTEDWHFTLYNDVRIIIPKGFEFDGASIPKPLYFLIAAFFSLLIIGVEVSPLLMLILSALFMLSGLLLSPVGILLIAGLIHDYAYAYGYIWAMRDGQLVKYKYLNGCRQDWDHLFFNVNMQVNGAIYADWLAAGLLKLFGGFAWDDSRRAKVEELTPGN